MELDTRGILAKIRANQAALAACPRHLFSATEVHLGQKLACERCGGTMGLTDIAYYIRGYNGGRRAVHGHMAGVGKG